MFTRTLRHLIAAAALAAAPAPAAYAEGQFAFGGLSPDCFTAAAVTMTPYDVNVQQNDYRMTHEQVYHNVGKTGSILLYGPVHPWRASGDGISFAVTFKDPDGSAPGGRVRAQLRHVGPGGIRIIATLDSNTTAKISSDAQVMSIGLPWSAVSARTGYFLVRVYVERTSTAAAPAAFGYNLCSTIF